MADLVPQKATVCQSEDPFPMVGEALESLRQFLGASAGWVCLHDAGAGLTFPVRRGAIPESWLRLQQARASVWGFAVREGPTLLNDLKPWPALGEPPPRNLLSCPLRRGETIFGHVALVNKPQGFATPDAAVLQGMVHHMTRLLDRLQAGPAPAVELSAGWRRILDRAGQGILILDESGTLVYANATWLDWSGFPAEELLGRQAPFPFWLSQHDLVRAMSAAAAVPPTALPFRCHDHSLLWCQVETVTEAFDGRRLTVAFLQRTIEPAPPSHEAVRPTADRPADELYSSVPLSYPTPSWLALLLEADGTTEGWGPRWEKLTGLTSKDVEGSRGDLVLDWLFPQQTDRERVADCLLQPDPAGCQFILDLATPAGSRPLLCTFLPLPSIESIGAKRRRWLLLVGEPELFAGPGTPSRGFVRSFALGLHQYLLHQLHGIDELARKALEQGGLAAEITDRLRAIHSRCRGMDALLEDLTDLARETAGERSVLPLADLVRAFLEERTSGRSRPDYELRIELSEEETRVRVNPQLLRVVLRQLLTNAEQSLADGLRRIEVRVLPGEDTVRCEIHDTGVGLPIDDWTLVLAPFFSTKGAFAPDPPRMSQEGTGLGLTVSRHLLALHEGQLDLRSSAGEGTTAIITLPRADNPASESRADDALSDTVRQDPRNPSRGPHLHGEHPSSARMPSTD